MDAGSCPVLIDDHHHCVSASALHFEIRVFRGLQAFSIYAEQEWLSIHLGFFLLGHYPIVHEDAGVLIGWIFGNEMRVTGFGISSYGTILSLLILAAH